MGGSLVCKTEEQRFKNHSIDKELDDTRGVIIFDKTRDFLIIDKSAYTTEEIEHMDKVKSTLIANLEMGGRSGACGGIVFSSTNSHSLSTVTQKLNSVLDCQHIGVGTVHMKTKMVF